MKPVLGMEGEKPAIITVAAQSEPTTSNKGKWSSSKKVVVGVIVGLVTLVTVATVIGVSFYFGSKVTRDNFKEARQTYHTEDGRVVEEETTVTDTEVDIRLPNQRESIFDYTHGLLVERMYDSKTGKKSACFARYMNESEAPSRDADKYVDGENLYLSKSDEGTTSQTKKWVSTTKKVPYHMISDSVARMCEGTDVFWMEEVSPDHMIKREACYEQFYTYICYPRYGCVYYCYLTYYCVTSSNRWYISREVEGYYRLC